MENPEKTEGEGIRSKVIGSIEQKEKNLIQIITLGQTVEVLGVNRHKYLMDKLNKKPDIVIYKAGKEIVKLRIYSTQKKYIDIETK